MNTHPLSRGSWRVVQGLWGGVRWYPRGLSGCRVDRTAWLHLLRIWGILWQPLVRVVPAKACTPPLPSSFPPVRVCGCERMENQPVLSRRVRWGFRSWGVAGLAVGWGDSGCCSIPRSL